MNKTILLLSALVFAFQANANTEKYRVAEGDNLVQILQNHQYGNEYRELMPFIAETIRLNPQVFKNGNADYITPGSIILLPHNPATEIVEQEVEVEPEPVPKPAAEPLPVFIGTVTVETGRVNIRRLDQLIPVDQEAGLYAQDIILTRDSSIAEIRLSDESRFMLGPQSSFSIDEYIFDEKDEGEKSLITTISKGALRVISGLISRLAPDNYRIYSDLTTTIGIRGTDFTVRSCVDKLSCGDLFGVSVAVQRGGIRFENSAGAIDLDTNQFTLIETADEVPELKPVPEGYFDLALPVNQIRTNKPWWENLFDWVEGLLSSNDEENSGSYNSRF